MAQELRRFTTPAEDLCLVLRTQVRWFTTALTPALGAVSNLSPIFLSNPNKIHQVTKLDFDGIYPYFGWP